MSKGRINIIDATPIEAARSGNGNGKDGTPKRDPDASEEQDCLWPSGDGGEHS